MKLITVEKLKEYINKRIIREKDKNDFLGYQGENLYWAWIGKVLERLTMKGHSQSGKGSNSAEGVERRK